MGVLGLWQILESVGHPIKIEGLEGKRLGVDANVWLYKFIRGFREKDNAPSLESHKLGLFKRISKLLFYKIKPVFVFDGPAPVLKRHTLERRQDIRHKHLSKVQDSAMRAMAQYLKQQYPDLNIDDVKIQLPEFRSNGLVAAEKLTNDDMDLFYLPPDIRDKSIDDSTDEESDMEIIGEQGGIETDINSKEFEELPPEVRYEILHEIKDQRRRIRNVEALPEDANSFSNFQLNRLTARRAIQDKIEKCEKEICSTYTGEFGDRAFHYQKWEKETRKTLPTNERQSPEKIVDDTQSSPNTQSNCDIVNEEKLKEAVLKFSEISKHEFIGEISTDSSDSETQPSQSKTNGLTAGKDITHDSSVIEISNIKGSGAGPALSESETDDDQSRSNEISAPNVSRSTREVNSNSNLSKGTSNDKQSEISVIDLSDSATLSDIEPEPSGSGENKVRINQASPTQIDRTVTIESSFSSTSLQSTTPFEDDQIAGEPTGKTTNTNDKAEKHPRSQFLKTAQKVVNTKSTDDESDLEIIETPAAIKEDIDSKKPIELQPKVCNEVERETKDQITTTRNAETKNHEPILTSQPSSSQTFSQSTNRSDDNKHIRHANKVTTKIIEEAKELLRLFGVPYIDAAGEAEAQCALLEKLKLTEGTITDDSDVWLFGAQNVYRYFFSDDKYVMQYKMHDIEYHLRLNRENLVCFAMLVGSDYTDGIKNVGPVTALEIISEFAGDDMEPLVKFRDWRDSITNPRDKSQLGGANRKKFLKFQLPENFPSRAVFEGYLRPLADSSEEKFTWGVPELDELREYARRNFGWDTRKIDDTLLPVMKKLSERKAQPTIDTFFFKTAANQNPERYRSKRVNKALSKRQRKE